MGCTCGEHDKRIQGWTMKSRPKLSFCRGDWIAILLVAALAVGTAAAFVPHTDSQQAHVVQIYQDGRLLNELPLDKDAALQVGGDYSNTVTISGGRAAITESDCPGADCVHSGWIGGAGRSIVCLPNRVEVRITGASDVDFTVR